MSRPDLLRLGIRGLAAWCVLALSGFWLARPIGEALLPVITFVLHLAGPEYAPALTLEPADHDHLIRLSALLLRPIPIAPGQALPAGVELPSGIHLLHTLLPPLILLSILSAWPVPMWRQRAFLLVAGLVLSVALVAAIAPFGLLGHLEMFYQDLARQTGHDRPESWMLRWMIFAESGGRWALPLAAAWACLPERERSAGRAKGTAVAVGTTRST